MPLYSSPSMNLGIRDTTLLCHWRLSIVPRGEWLYSGLKTLSSVARAWM